MDELNPITRQEKIIAGENIQPITRMEKLLAGEDLEPVTRLEHFVKKYKAGGGTGGGGSCSGINPEWTDWSYLFYQGARSESIEKLKFTNSHNVVNFDSAFYNCTNLTSIPELDTSKGTVFGYMFRGCSKIQTIPQLDTSNGTVFAYMFYDCSSLTEIPTLDISKGTSFYNVFYNCRKLETVSLTTAKSDLQTNTFQGCTALKNITIGEGWAVNIYLNYSEQLTVESLHGMIENFADLTGKTAKTFQIGARNLAKIDAEHLTMLQNKNWNYS